jgi:hypothetical protein
VYFPQTNSNSVPDVYILSESISGKRDDVEAGILLYLARNAKAENQRTALLDSALRGYPVSVFTGELRALKGLEEAPPQTPAQVPAAIPAEEPIAFTITPIADDTLYAIHSGDGGTVNAHNNPGLRGSAVLRQFEEGDLVLITAQTNETETIDGVSAVWYRVTLSGEEETSWVFGAYVE